MLEQRSYPRMQVNYEAYCQADGRFHATQCHDISPKGVGIYCDEMVEPGLPVELDVIVNKSALSFNMGGFVRHVTRNPAPDKSDLPFLVGVEFNDESKESYPFMDVQGDVKSLKAGHTIRINAPAQLCYQLIWDYDNYPKWVRFFESHEVRARYQDGKPRLVEWTANAFIRKVHFTNEYSYDDDNLILSWVSAGGEFLYNNGRWKFAPRGENATSATFELSAAVDFVAPNRIIRYFATKAMGKAMADFAKFVATKVKNNH